MAAVIARCTIELAEKTDLASKVLDNAQVQMSVRLNRLANEIKESREAMAAAATGSAKHSEALNRWTKALVFVTVVYTVVTAVGVAVTVYQELRPSSPTEVEGVAPVLPEVRSRGSGSPS